MLYKYPKTKHYIAVKSFSNMVANPNGWLNIVLWLTCPKLASEYAGNAERVLQVISKEANKAIVYNKKTNYIYSVVLGKTSFVVARKGYNTGDVLASYNVGKKRGGVFVPSIRYIRRDTIGFSQVLF
jgi:hypothetical protein